MSISIKGHSSEHKNSFGEDTLAEAIILKDGTRIDLENQREAVTVYDDVHLSGSFNKVIDPAAVVIYGNEYPVEKFSPMTSIADKEDFLDIYYTALVFIDILMLFKLLYLYIESKNI
ncbi:hypothetical protein ACPWSR_12305 [Alloiococcus sp. CFN-8]|uniref:hypothetical protein n=1 Tax=Alloiococcus sp. CFN-8 TaxID=3416081 RepID=UPI003CE99448